MSDLNTAFRIMFLMSYTRNTEHNIQPSVRAKKNAAISVRNTKTTKKKDEIGNQRMLLMHWWPLSLSSEHSILYNRH